MKSSPTKTLPAEIQLLVCSARTTLSASNSAQIRELAAGKIDWAFLLRQAHENSVTPLLNLHLHAASAAIPSEHDEILKAAIQENAVRSLILSAELIRLQDVFRPQGILAIPYKGPVLAAQAYGDIALREFEDLDIIVRERDLAKAGEAMTSSGYKPQFPASLLAEGSPSRVPAEFSYFDEARHILVELHTERTMRHFPVAPSLDDLAERMVSVQVSGHEVRTFSAEDALVMLCVHGSKHFWDRLSWIADLAELIHAYPHLNWDEVLNRAGSLKAQSMLHSGLLLAEELLETPLPVEVVARMKRDLAASLVAQEARRSLLWPDWPPLDAGRRFQLRRKMVPGVFAGWRYAMRLTTMPAEEDWSAMSLPRPLAPLYSAIRPFRLLRKYGWPGKSSERGAN